jgi:hypothetical protein
MSNEEDAREEVAKQRSRDIAPRESLGTKWISATLEIS